MKHTDRQAIIDQHRNARLANATGSAARLAEIEKAALEFQSKVFAARDDLVKEGRLTTDAINHELAVLAHAWIEEKAKLEPLLANIEASIAVAPATLPERTETHREICAHFRTLKGDLRQEAIARAISMKDRELAEALATEPASTSSLIEQDRQLIIERLQPGDFAKSKDRAVDLQSRAQGARATLAEVTQNISGARA